MNRESIPAQLSSAKKEAATRFLTDSARAAYSTRAISYQLDLNIVGVGIGKKIKGGQPTGTDAVRVYVNRKFPKAQIPQPQLVPAVIRGVPTDVVETGRFKAFTMAPLPPTTPTDRWRPIRPGTSIGPPPIGNLVEAGTLGAIVKSGGAQYILSNNHVLANEDKLPVGTAIFQPALLDKGIQATDRVASLSKTIPLSPRGSNSVDCAIAAIDKTIAADPTILPKVGKLATTAPIDATDGMKVHKVGRTTGYTTGSVLDISADVNIQYDIGTLTFQGQILITPDLGQMFSDAGDSGSLIVDRGLGRATGLLFGGSPKSTIANHISDVLTALQIQLAG
jgi:hypothetical protein